MYLFGVWIYPPLGDNLCPFSTKGEYAPSPPCTPYSAVTDSALPCDERNSKLCTIIQLRLTQPCAATRYLLTYRPTPLLQRQSSWLQTHYTRTDISAEKQINSPTLNPNHKPKIPTPAQPSTLNAPNPRPMPVPRQRHVPRSLPLSTAHATQRQPNIDAPALPTNPLCGGITATRNF